MSADVTLRWKPGSRIKCSAGAAYHFLERIRAENNGDLNLTDAVHKSKPKDAPLHNDLEWNNARCGDLYRRDQMRRITRRLEVIRSDTAPTRAYEAIRVEVAADEPTDAPAPVRHVFRRTEDILADPAGRAELLGQALRDAVAFRRRYAALSELATVIAAIDETVANAQ